MNTGGSQLQQPPVSVDLDGVVCSPFLNRNIAIKRDLNIPSLPTEVLEGKRYRHPANLQRLWQEIRYFGRRPLPGVRDGLKELAKIRRPVLVTGRSWLAESLILRWLERYALAEYFSEIVPNTTNLSSAQFKLWTARRMQITEHIDDDGSVAIYLAKHGIRVFLRDWPRNRGLPYPKESVVVCRDLAEIAEVIRDQYEKLRG